MHIGLIIDSLIPNGAQMVVRRLAEGLTDRACKVTVLYYHHFGNGTPTTRADLDTHGVKSIWIRGPRTGHRRYAKRIDGWRTARLIRRLCIEVANVHTWERAYSLQVARQLPPELPVVLTHHGTRICNRGMTFSNRLHLGVNSRYRYEYEDRDNNSNCRAIDIGIDRQAIDRNKLPRHEARESLGLDADKPVMLTIGRCNRHKGCDIWIDVVRRLERRYPGAFTYVFAGAYERGGYSPNFYGDLLSLRERHDNVIIKPILPHRDIVRWICACDLLLVTSRTESFALKAVEALYCGRPVVTHFLGVLDDLIEEGVSGAIVDYMDIDALTAAAAGWLLRPRKVKAHIPQKYFVDRMVECYEKCFRDMLAGQSSQHQNG